MISFTNLEKVLLAIKNLFPFLQFANLGQWGESLLSVVHSTSSDHLIPEKVIISKSKLAQHMVPKILELRFC